MEGKKERLIKEKVLKLMPRLLSQADMDFCSPSHGCFDRNFWHYKIRDFSSAILQQNCLSLALLYKNSFKGNIYYKKEEIKELCTASIRFWKKIQLRDGSFNEYYPNEHSIPATAFSLAAVSECVQLLGLNNRSISEAIEKACWFLISNPEKKALNQEIASAFAIYNSSIAIRKPELKKESLKKLFAIEKLQNSEGWFSEYSGADLGYLSVSINFLAEFYSKAKQQKNKELKKKLKKMLSKAIEFSSYFLHPDKSYGGMYGSRNTSYFLFNGLAISSEFSSLASKMLEELAETNSFLDSVDDRYLCHYIMPSLCSSLISCLKQKQNKRTANLPYTRNFVKYFKNSGILVYSDNNSYIIASLNKLGVIRAFTKEKAGTKKNRRNKKGAIESTNIFNDYGYNFRLKRGFATTNWLSSCYEKNIQKIEKKGRLTIRASISGFVHKLSYISPGPIKHIMLRAASLFFGRRIIPVLKSIFISPTKKAKILFIRNIEIKQEKSNTAIKITDIIKTGNKVVLYSNNRSLRYVPSSRYFEPSELESLNKPIREKEIRHGCVIKKQVSICRKKASLEILKLK